MTVLFLSDLDDTLFQTRRKCTVDVGSLSVASTLVDGAPSGFSTPRQRALLATMTNCSFMPVTARSRAVLARVDVPRSPAICGNGGCIVGADGEVDAEWRSRLAAEGRCGAEVRETHSAIAAGLERDRFRHWVVEEDGVPVYIVIKSATPGGADLAESARCHRDLLPPGWRSHLNGNNLAHLPPWIGKRQAVAHVLERVRAATPDVCVVGVGDSASDAGFMDLCDFALAPTASQLWRGAVEGSEWLA